MYFPLYGNCSCQLVPLSALAGFFFSFFPFFFKKRRNVPEGFEMSAKVVLP